MDTRKASSARIFPTALASLSCVNNPPVLQWILAMLRFLVHFPYIQCPLQVLNSVTVHKKTGKFPYREKALSGLSTLFRICRVGASLLDLPHFFIIPTIRYFPIRPLGTAPKAYL